MGSLMMSSAHFHSERVYVSNVHSVLSYGTVTSCFSNYITSHELHIRWVQVDHTDGRLSLLRRIPRFANVIRRLERQRLWCFANAMNELEEQGYLSLIQIRFDSELRKLEVDTGLERPPRLAGQAAEVDEWNVAVEIVSSKERLR